MSIGRSVSLYSLQEPYFLGKMDLEACVAAVKKPVGADGIEVLVDQMMERQAITEELKVRDQMAWVGAVNNIRNAAEEIVLKEIVYI